MGRRCRHVRHNSIRNGHCQCTRACKFTCSSAKLRQLPEQTQADVSGRRPRMRCLGLVAPQVRALYDAAPAVELTSRRGACNVHNTHSCPRSACDTVHDASTNCSRQVYSKSSRAASRAQLEPPVLKPRLAPPVSPTSQPLRERLSLPARTYIPKSSNMNGLAWLLLCASASLQLKFAQAAGAFCGLSCPNQLIISTPACSHHHSQLPMTACVPYARLPCFTSPLGRGRPCQSCDAGRWRARVQAWRPTRSFCAASSPGVK